MDDTVRVYVGIYLGLYIWYYLDAFVHFCICRKTEKDK